MRLYDPGYEGCGGANDVSATVPGLGAVRGGKLHLLKVRKHIAEALVGYLRQQPGDHPKGVGNLILAVTAFKVTVKGHEGMKAEAMVGNAPDEGMNLGGGPMIGDFAGPVEGEFLNQGKQPDYGQLDGVFAFQGIHTATNLGKSVHGVVSKFSVYPRRSYLKIIQDRALGKMRRQMRLLFTPILTFPRQGGRDFEIVSN